MGTTPALDLDAKSSCQFSSTLSGADKLSAHVRRGFFRVHFCSCSAAAQGSPVSTAHDVVTEIAEIAGGFQSDVFSSSEEDEAEQSKWNALLELCFPCSAVAVSLHVVEPRHAKICMFACDVLAGPRDNQLVHVFD